MYKKVHSVGTLEPWINIINQFYFGPRDTVAQDCILSSSGAVERKFTVAILEGGNLCLTLRKEKEKENQFDVVVKNSKVETGRC